MRRLSSAPTYRAAAPRSTSSARRGKERRGGRDRGGRETRALERDRRGPIRPAADADGDGARVVATRPRRRAHPLAARPVSIAPSVTRASRSRASPSSALPRHRPHAHADPRADGALVPRHARAPSPGRRLRGFFSLGLSCVVLTRREGFAAMAIVQAAEDTGTPLLLFAERSSAPSTRCTALLDDRLAPRASPPRRARRRLRHRPPPLGRAPSARASARSTSCMRGHRLVADDVVECDYRPPGMVFGAAAELLRHHLEVRGLGILNIKDLFGVTAIRERKRIDVVVKLVEWYEDTRVRPDGRRRSTLHDPRRDIRARGARCARAATWAHPRGRRPQRAAQERRPPRRARVLRRLEERRLGPSTPSRISPRVPSTRPSCSRPIPSTWRRRTALARRDPRGRRRVRAPTEPRAPRESRAPAARAPLDPGRAPEGRRECARRAPASRPRASEPRADGGRGHRLLGRRQIDRAPRARGPRLLLRRQPSDRARARPSRSARAGGIRASRSASTCASRTFLVRSARGLSDSRPGPARVAVLFLDASDETILVASVRPVVPTRSRCAARRQRTRRSSTASAWTRTPRAAPRAATR